MGLMMVACTQHDAGEGMGTTLTAPEVSSVTSSSAVLKATATGPSIVNRGFCIGTSSAPTTDGTMQSVPAAKMETVLRSLKAGTTYYVRAFIKTNDQTLYSPETTFTTSASLSQSDLDNWQAPLWVDDYRDFSTWAARYKWNLSNVHDPSVMKAADGYYYMYQTDAGFGNPQAGHGHFHCRRSLDLVTWEYMGATMKEMPSWVLPKLNEIRHAMGLEDSEADLNLSGYWAPCVRKVNDNLYRMYYAITIDGTIDGPNSWGERAFIGLMETSNPADINSWEDKGYVLTNYSDRELNFHVSPTAWQECYYKYNAIDPSYIITPEGSHWLIYGSWNSGIAAVELNASTGMPVTSPMPNPWGAENEAAFGKRIFRRAVNDRWQASEAPEIIYRDGWYYLFLAYDGLDVPYNTRVVRSRNVNGPFYNCLGQDVTDGNEAFPIMTHPYKFEGDQGWVGISHCAVFEDGNGNWFYASQQRFPTTAGGAEPNALMLCGVRSILWTADGWPVVLPERYAAVPQVPITEEDIVGEWENINLEYKYAEMDLSESATLNADHTLTAGSSLLNGTWSFDAATNTLTITDGTTSVALIVARECDWEASPRKHTLVWAGFNGTTTFWGKKK